ncbi:hypothetical protein BVRB_2g037020 [Beta vulgaris subsp. vulgaris]|uniref:Uncharacterized protein n=1 Tax=Beta vulgaris subsp. vulgaris TaxID=3555 RepID=A0A0J8CVD8_BETVV|nr:hypothetical protein BVRB_2g037020 [Beta vulgaris subsp. vulgaris]
MHVARTNYAAYFPGIPSIYSQEVIDELNQTQDDGD